MQPDQSGLTPAPYVGVRSVASEELLAMTISAVSVKQ